MKQLFTLLLVSGLSLFTLQAQDTLPDVILKSMNGKPTAVTDYASNGKTTVISFWATWCTPCKKELDAIHKKYAEWQEQYNMELIAVTIDDQRSLPRAKQMVAQKKWDYTILSDVKQDFQQAMNVRTIPHTFIVDKNGKIVYSHNGYLPGDEKELEKKLMALAKG